MSLRTPFRYSNCLAAFTFVLLMGAQNAWSQTCNATNITLQSQAQVNAFQATYGPCNSVEGHLALSGSVIFGGDFTDLSPLNDLVEVGSLIIGYAGTLSGINGLNSLHSIYGDLDIVFSFNISHLDGLTSLERIDGRLSTFQVPDLQSIDGLANLKHVGNGILLGTSEVSTLEVFAGLETFSGPLAFIGLKIANLFGLEFLPGNVTSVTLESNTNLTSLQGFPDATRSIESLRIYRNDALRDISGLANIDEVTGTVQIQQNNFLRSLAGLDNLLMVGQQIDVIQNPNLTDCTSLRRLLDQVDDALPGPGPGVGGVPDVGNMVSLFGNRTICNSNAGIFDYVFWSDFD